MAPMGITSISWTIAVMLPLERILAAIDNDWTPFNLTANAPDDDHEHHLLSFGELHQRTSSMIFYAIRVNGTPVVLSSGRGRGSDRAWSRAASVQECCVGNMFDGSLNNRFRRRSTEQLQSQQRLLRGRLLRP